MYFPVANVTKIYGCNLSILLISKRGCPWQAFPAQVGEARSLPDVSTYKVLYLGRLQPYQQTLDKTERPSRDKYSSLLRNYSLKMFISLAPGACTIKNFTAVIVAVS